jgi:hypothetical protein
MTPLVSHLIMLPIYVGVIYIAVMMIRVKNDE